MSVSGEGVVKGSNTEQLTSLGTLVQYLLYSEFLKQDKEEFEWEPLKYRQWSKCKVFGNSVSKPGVTVHPERCTHYLAW